MAESNKVDDLILRYADSRSAEEISEMLGGLVSPTKVAARRKFLLTSRNPLDQAEQEELTFYKLRALLAELEGEFQTLDHTKVQLQLIKQIFERIDKRRAVSDQQLNQLYANQAQMMFDAIRIAFAALLESLSVDEAEARAALSTALPQAVLVISERNAGEPIAA